MKLRLSSPLGPLLLGPLLLGSLLLGSVAALGQASETVVIADGLEPTELVVSTGTTVTWQNEDDERRRMRSSGGPVEFDSGNLEPGESFTFTFVIEGSYPYLDERNDEDPSYRGTVVVTAPEATAGPLPVSAAITIVDEAFHPPSFEVATGATVRWDHLDGDEEHTVTAEDGAFNSGVMVGGDAFEQTFDTAGVYPYFCAIHPEMVGTITVSGTDAEPDGGPAVAEPTDEVPAPSAVAPAAGTAGEVAIVDLTFQPDTIEVAAGSSVTWRNDDAFDHTVTASEGAFNSGIMGEGQEFSQAFDTPGTFEYFCAIHPSMTGTVVVSDAGG